VPVSAMPKKDGFGDQKKDADKAKKKIAEMKAKDAKAAAKEEVVAAVAAPTNGHNSGPKAKNGTLKVATDTTFAKAAAEAAEEYEEEAVAEDYDYDDDSAQQSAASAPSKAKKETKADLLKKQKLSKKDEFKLLEEQEQQARKQRIISRFLRMLIVGVVIDYFADSNGSNGNEKKKVPDAKKKAKKSASGDDYDFSPRSIKEKWDLFSGPLMALVIVAAVLYGKAMEDGFRGALTDETNFYDVMSLPRDAGVMDIRKKYKSLSLTWHPDKNPECEACPEKFAAISKAYETLSNVEKKKAYDNKRASSDSLTSASSVDLTAEDFEAKVLRSNEVWFVEVYDPTDGASSSFHPIWEEVASTNGKFARFGRVDLTTQKGVVSFLPMRIAITPMVFRFARGETTDNWMWQGSSEEAGGGPLQRWITDMYPVLNRMETAADVTSFWKRTGSSRLLISGNGGVIKRGAQNKKFLPVLRETHMWADYMALTSADGKDATEALKAFGVELPTADKKTGHPWTVVYIPAGETQNKVIIASTPDLKEFPAKIEEVVQQALSSEAPLLTVRNHRQLCQAGSASRTFCLVLVDMHDSTQLAQVLQDVATARTEYAKELAELKDSEDGESSQEEPFRIQPVRVMTGTSRFPSQPVAVSPDFYTAWTEVGRAPMFLVELETQRVSAVKSSVLATVSQQIAYEDLKFKELPEDFHLVRALPDPEVPLKRVFFRWLTSALGALFTFILVAGVTAVAPELDMKYNGVGAGAIFLLVLIVWPLACRRLLSLVMGGV